MGLPCKERLVPVTGGAGSVAFGYDEVIRGLQRGSAGLFGIDCPANEAFDITIRTASGRLLFSDTGCTGDQTWESNPAWEAGTMIFITNATPAFTGNLTLFVYGFFE